MELKSLLTTVVLVFVLSSCAYLSKPTSDASGFIPHVLDSVQTAAVLSSGGVELNPVGWPGVTFMKIGMEVVARQQRNAGNLEWCYSLALGGRLGGWAGFSATAAGLLGAGAVGMVTAGLALPILMYTWTVETARITCYEVSDVPLDTDYEIKSEPFGNK